MSSKGVPAVAFRTERDMHPIARSSSWIQARGGHVFVRHEVPMGRCIPDVVVVRLSSLPTVERIHWTFRHAFMLWLLRRHRSLHLATLVERMYDRPGKLAEAAKQLLGSGVIEQRPSGAFYLSPAMRRIRTEVVAVELKIRRWRQALQQSMSYRRFADQVIVAMDEAVLANAPVGFDAFRTAGVGLYALRRDAPPRQLVAAERRPVSTPEREFLVGSVMMPARQSGWSRK